MVSTACSSHEGERCNPSPRCALWRTQRPDGEGANKLGLVETDADDPCQRAGLQGFRPSLSQGNRPAIENSKGPLAFLTICALTATSIFSSVNCSLFKLTPMTTDTEETRSSPFPLQIEIPAFGPLYGGAPVPVSIHPGLTTLVGPNGAGKTRMLRQIASQTQARLFGTSSRRKVRYLAAGRSSPYERFRGNMDGPGHWDNSGFAIGNSSYTPHWSTIDSVIGDFLALEARADLRLKIETRLQQLFSRSLRLQWGQTGLGISMVSMHGGPAYTANHEASGILHLVALLAAIHNDEIGVLIIDEPEISLHPQHQAFILQEMLLVAGDPAINPDKKIIVVATHSPSMLALQSVADIPKIVFFSSPDHLPAQIDAGVPELRARKIKGLISRLGATHKLAFFANTVLLVEGPSDEIIALQLAQRTKHPLLPQNTQIVPVTGKGEFVEVSKLFKLFGKRVVVMADLDTLTDSNELVNYLSLEPSAVTVASAKGHASIIAFDSQLRSELAKFVNENWNAIFSAVGQHRYWTTCPDTDRTEKIKRRAVLATLLTNPDSMLNLANPTGYQALRGRYLVLLQMLEEVGCHMLTRGTIEDYYSDTYVGLSKPEAAAEEAASLVDAKDSELAYRYADVIRALANAAPGRPISEDALLRPILAAAIASLMQVIEPETSEKQIAVHVQNLLASDAEIFEFTNLTVPGNRRLRVSVRSPIFPRASFPFEVQEGDNLGPLLRTHLAN